MLLDVLKMIGMLFIFGLAYFVVWAMMEFVDSFIPVTGDFRLVVFGLMSIIPLAYFAGRARDLWIQTKVAEE